MQQKYITDGGVSDNWSKKYNVPWAAIDFEVGYQKWGSTEESASASLIVYNATGFVMKGLPGEAYNILWLKKLPGGKPGAT